MPFVFISHAKNDKPRLRPIVEALWRADFKVWLDNPQDAGFTSDEIDQFLRLHAGGRWEDEILEALRDASAILVCWSRKSIDENRRPLHDEIFAGKLFNKLVACRLDDIETKDIPRTDAAQQIVNLNPEQPAPQLEGAFNNLISDIRRVVQRNLLESRSKIASRNDLTPYLADRREQIRALDAVLEQIGETGGVRPVFCVAPSNERPDEFFDRAGLFDAEWTARDVRWQEIEVDWPDRVPLRRFGEAYGQILCRKLGRPGGADIGSIVSALHDQGRQIAAIHRLDASEWCIDGSARIEAWLGVWQQIAAAAPKLQVVAWIQLRLRAANPGWKECPGGSSGVIANRHIWRSLKALQARLAATGRLPALEVLDVLPPISFADAIRWARRAQPEAGAKRRELEREVERLYPDMGLLRGLIGPKPRKYGVNHEVFADTLASHFQKP